MQSANCKVKSEKSERGLTVMGTTRRHNDALENGLLNFAAGCGRAVDALPETRMGRHVAAQLVRCGTSAAPTYAQARAAESRNDLVHKLGIALKELRETRVWLLMCFSLFTFR